MGQDRKSLGVVVGEAEVVSLEQACRLCRVGRQWVVEFIQEGVIEPAPDVDPPVFDAAALQRLRVATRLRRDLGVNSAGAALALQLMEEIERLRRDLRRSTF